MRVSTAYYCAATFPTLASLVFYFYLQINFSPLPIFLSIFDVAPCFTPIDFCLSLLLYFLHLLKPSFSEGILMPLTTSSSDFEENLSLDKNNSGVGPSEIRIILQNFFYSFIGCSTSASTHFSASL